MTRRARPPRGPRRPARGRQFRTTGMTQTDDPTLPIDLPPPAPAPRRRRFRKRVLLVLLVPVLMFSGAVIGMYYQPPGLQRFYALTGLQPGGGAENPIALPPEIEMPARMVETLLPSDVVGLARIMPRGDVAVVAAPHRPGDARVAVAVCGPLRRRPGLEVLGVCGPALWPITVRLCRSSDPLPDALTAVACSSLGVGCVAAAPR